MASVTVESWASGPLPLMPEPISIVPASTAAASNSTCFAATSCRGGPARSSMRVQRHLLQHEAAVAARVVDLVRVPLAEMVVGPLVDRVVEVVRPRIDGQLVELVRGSNTAVEHSPGSVARGLPGPFRSTRGSGPRPTPAPRINSGIGRTHSWS